MPPPARHPTMQANAQPTATRTGQWLGISLVFASIWLLALAAIAQPAINSIANTSRLPLRNIQIEVRQVQRSSREQTGAQVNGTVHINSQGVGDAPAQLRLRQQQEQQSGTALQQVLVLNGRAARIALRTSTPLRLVQTVFRNGAVVYIQGTVLLDSATGFMATPRWDGSDRAELEIAATQATLSSGNSLGGVNPASSGASTLVLPMGEWVTVAQSDEDSRTSQSGLNGMATQSGQNASELQVRLTVR